MLIVVRNMQNKFWKIIILLFLT